MVKPPNLLKSNEKGFDSVVLEKNECGWEGKDGISQHAMPAHEDKTAGNRWIKSTNCLKTIEICNPQAIQQEVANFQTSWPIQTNKQKKFCL